MDPSTNDNKVTSTAAACGNVGVLKVLLGDARVNPLEAVFWAASENKVAALKLLLRYVDYEQVLAEVDTPRNNLYAGRGLSSFGYSPARARSRIEELDPPSETEIFLTSAASSLGLFERAMRCNPNVTSETLKACFRIACSKGVVGVVWKLVSESLVNVFDCWDLGVRLALANDQIDVASLLLAEPAVIVPFLQNRLDRSLTAL